MKRQKANNKLAFGKATVTELNETQLNSINGGTTTNMIPILISFALTLTLTDNGSGSDFGNGFE
jgi:hypothetical protein